MNTNHFISISHHHPQNIRILINKRNRVSNRIIRLDNRTLLRIMIMLLLLLLPIPLNLKPSPIQRSLILLQLTLQIINLIPISTSISLLLNPLNPRTLHFMNRSRQPQQCILPLLKHAFPLKNKKINIP